MKHKGKYTVAGILAVILVAITYKLPEFVPDTFNEQAFIVQLLSKYRSGKVSRQALEDLKKDFVLINTSYDLSLGSIAEHEGDSYYREKATTAITNRQLLFNLFRWLRDNPERYNTVVVDILFYSRSLMPDEQQYDDSLTVIFKQLAQQQKVILAASYNSDNEIVQDNYTSYIDASNYGDVRANIRSEKNTVYLLSTGDNVTGLPLLMLNRIDTVTHSYLSFPGLFRFRYTNGDTKTSFNYVIPRLYIPPSFLDSLNRFGHADTNEELNYFNLGDLRVGIHAKLKGTLTEEKKKSVFIGAFSGDHPDRHETIFGKMDGAIYLLNIYYNLVHKNSLVNWFACFLLFVFYFICLVWIMVIPHKAPNDTTLARFLFNKMIAGNWHYIALTIIVVIYYYCFEQVINVLYISAIFLLIETAVKIKNDYLDIKLKQRGN